MAGCIEFHEHACHSLRARVDELEGEVATLRGSKEVKVCPTKDIDDENIEDEFQRHIAKYGGKACYDEGFHCYRHNPCCHCGTSLSPDDTKETK